VALWQNAQQNESPFTLLMTPTLLETLPQSFVTARLQLRTLALTDAAFVMELVNSEGWIRFIGERHVKDETAALQYIQRLIDNPTICYWVVCLRNDQSPIGVVTVIQRHDLPHPDLGFAFLPKAYGQGYAVEAAAVVLRDLCNRPELAAVVAISIPANTGSIRLLEKLGFHFESLIVRETETLSLYQIESDKTCIDRIVQQFFSVFRNVDRLPDWDLLYTTCIPSCLIVKKTPEGEVAYHLEAFIAPRKEILSNGSLTGFQEQEISAQTLIVGNIAQRFSRYEKSGMLHGIPFHEFGNKCFQFVKTAEGWKITALLWEDDVV
jgi:RimJ/RimL family protein N-acetyltransferase